MKYTNHPSIEIYCPACGQKPTITGTSVRIHDKHVVNNYNCSCSNGENVTLSCYLSTQQDVEYLEQFHLYIMPFKFTWAIYFGWEIIQIQNPNDILLDAGTEEISIQEAFKTLKRYHNVKAFL